MQRLLLFPLVVVAALALPGAASAHGLGADSASSVPEYVWLGFRHMIAGWDHLLFAAGIVFLAGGVRGAAKLISLFVAGHSLTLLVATLAGWQVNAAAVDVVIALSVAYVGVRLLHGRPERWTTTALAIFGFGLVHGLGLATRLQELELPGGGALVARILAFNLGVELGQLAALSLIVGAALLGARLLRGAAAPRRLAGVALTATGLLAGATLGFAAVKPDDFASASVGRGVVTGSCAEQTQPPPAGSLGGGHPERSFYEPGEGPAEPDLQHIVADGFIVVMYRPSLPEEERDALADWSRTGAAVVVPAAQRSAAVLRATTSERTLTCTVLNLDELDGFRERWLEKRRRDSTS